MTKMRLSDVWITLGIVTGLLGGLVILLAGVGSPRGAVAGLFMIFMAIGAFLAAGYYREQEVRNTRSEPKTRWQNYDR